MIDTLLHISGGMDSTYVLYDWLRNNPKKYILLHHVNLRHQAEDRLDLERKAVKNILTWLTDNGMGNFVYEESSFDYGSLSRITIKDIQIVSMFSAILLKHPKYRSVRKLLLAWHQGEVNSDEINRGYRVRNMLDCLEVGRKINLVFPIEHMSREDMAADMPIELLMLCHSCRKPVDGNNCGQCKTCLELIDADIFDIVGRSNTAK
jgi:7-cyano-7-deazaguanine synthase in queuosine biosynthesis